MKEIGGQDYSAALAPPRRHSQRHGLRPHPRRSRDAPRADPDRRGHRQHGLRSADRNRPDEQVEEAERALYQIAEKGRFGEGGFKFP